MELVPIVPIVGVATVFFVAFLAWDVLKRDTGTSEMVAIADMIYQGAMAFLRRQYQTIAMLAVVVGVLISALIGYIDQSVNTGIETGIAFLVGATASGLAGFIGMYVAVRSNVRTASAARR